MVIMRKMANAVGMMMCSKTPLWSSNQSGSCVDMILGTTEASVAKDLRREAIAASDTTWSLPPTLHELPSFLILPSGRYHLTFRFIDGFISFTLESDI